jgi:phage shock protein E
MKLVLLFLAYLSTIGCSSNPGNEGYKNLSVAESKTLLNNPEIVLMDVRTPGEIAQGYIKGTSVFNDFNSQSFEKNLESLDKTKTYVVYCRSGGRSASSAELMTKKGFLSVYNLSGGISSWDEPLVR